MDNNREVKHTSCNCPAGAGGKCKHICAIIYYINDEEGQSKTDLPQQWGKPSKVGELMYKKGKTIESLFPKKPQALSIIANSTSHQTLVNDYNILEIPCSLSIILKENFMTDVERECKDCLHSIIDKIEFEQIINTNKRHISTIFFKQNQSSKLIKLAIFPLNFLEHNFFYKNIYLTKSKIFEIFIQTLSQADSEQWKKERVYRLSASAKAHKIKTCKNWTVEGLKKLNQIFFLDNNLGNKGNINVKYGKQTESIALNEFKHLSEKNILKCGLVIDSVRPWICASPDGIILSDAGIVESVLEIKCPISCKNKPIIENGTPNLKYIQIDKNGKPELKKSSMYFTQCQMLIHCTGLNSCILFIYNNIDPISIIIEKDEYFIESLLERMTFYYFNFYLQKLVQ